MRRVAFLAILLAGCRDPIGYTALNGMTWCEMYAQRGGYERLGWCIYSTAVPVAIVGVLLVAAAAIGVGVTLQWRAAQAQARAAEWDALPGGQHTPDERR